MAIIQISKIQVRSGNLVDLPQLDEAEFGWASDSKRLFIGKTTPNENIEILTSYSNIDYSQLTGSYGNLNLINPVTGQIQVFDKASNAWLVGGGNALDPGEPSYWSSNPIHLGNVSTLKIGGGAIGYVLETDGTGNLNWTPKGVISANISAATKTNPVVITTSANNFFTDGQYVTITNVSGMTQLNGNSYYANVLTANTFSLYSDLALTVPVDGTGYSTYTGNGRAIASVGGSGGGGGGAGGTTFSVQYNYAGVPTGDASFTWNNSTSTLNVTGTSNVTGNLNVTGNAAASRLVSNVATGTAPLVVTSTTRVANLNVAYANVSDFVNITTVATGVHYPMLANALTGNVSEFANANLNFDVSTGLLTTTRLSSTGNSNVGNLGTGGLITATGNLNAGNIITTGQVSATGNVSGNLILGNGSQLSSVNASKVNITDVISSTNYLMFAGSLSGNQSVYGNNKFIADGITGIVSATGFSGTGNSNVGNLGTGGVITATGNITGGNLATGGTLSAGGNANVGNLGTGGLITATGNITGGNLITGGLITATGNIIGGNLVTGGTLSAGGNANVGNLGTTGVFATTLSATGNANAANINGTNLNLTQYGNVKGMYVGLSNAIANLNVNSGNNFRIVGYRSAPTTYTDDAGSYAVVSNAAVHTFMSANVTSISTIVYSNLSTVYIQGAPANIAPLSAPNKYALYVGSGNSYFGGNIITTDITTGANTTAGNITGNWSLTAGSRLQATYADLAEYYEADQLYEAGTVLMFGGEKEVTIAEDGTTKVAGVVSTNPAYLMNSNCSGHKVAIALQGRVPVKVRGRIRKGDLMVSGGDGFARPWNNASIGMIIGKSIQDFDDIEGIIEVAVGRL